MWSPMSLDWLHALRPGDAWTSVIPHKDRRGGWIVRVSVLKRSKSELLVRVGNVEERYRLKDGAKIGGVWHNLPQPATEEEVQKADRENRFVDMVVRLQTTDFKTLPFEIVEALDSVLSGHKTKRKKDVCKTVRC